jgi:glycosyltransferase involved in cell wall biosynthesis
LKIGIFCPTFNVYGGGEFVAATIANTLAQNNYDVILFTNEEINQQEIEKFFGQRLNPSIKAIVKPSIVQPRGLLDFCQTIFRSYFFRLKCDMWVDVYSNCLFPWTNISYVHFPLLNHYFYKQRFPYLKSRHIREVGALPHVIFEKHLINDEEKLVLANSQYTADEIRKYSGKKATVLYPPVSSTYFGNNPKNLLKKQRKNVVVTISRFGYTKGLEKIPFIALLTPDIQFALIGRVHNKNALISLQKLTKKLGLKERVKFFPDISRSKMQKILENAKIYLHTMIGEHFGISIVEAMAMGCTPIVHNSGGPKEFVPEYLRYNSIYEAAATIMKEIYEWSPEKALKIVKIAEKFKEENFSKEFIKLFEEYIKDIFT